MALTLVIVTVDFHSHTYEALQYAMKYASNTDNQYIVIDNGSDNRFSDYLLEQPALPYSVRNIYNPNNVGVPQAYICGVKEARNDIVVFTHADVIIHAQGWDDMILQAYENNPKLAISGFFSAMGCGSNGGRLHSVSNMQGNLYGSNWKEHGSHNTGVVAATVLDGLSIHYRRSIWLELFEKYQWLQDLPIHHHYDRIFPMLAILSGYDCAGIGIAFDHGLPEGLHPISSISEKYKSAAIKWLEEHNIPYTGNHDQDIYNEAERVMFALFGRYLPMVVRDVSDNGVIEYRYIVNALM